MDKESLAKQVSGWFVTDTRSDGEKFYKFNGNLPEAAKESFFDSGFEVHDAYYEAGAIACDALAEALEYEEGEAKDIVDGFEWSEYIETDAYTGDLLKWLGSHISFPGYIGEAVQSYGTVDGWEILAQAQSLFRQEVANMVRKAVLAVIEEGEDG